MEHEQVPVPVQNRIVIGRVADLDTPGVLAVVAREAGGILQVTVRNRIALHCAHCKAIVIIDVVTDVAAVGDDRERAITGYLTGVIGVRDVIRGSAVLDLTDQTAVVAAAGNGTPVEAVGHVRVAVGAAALVAGLAGDAAVRAVVVVIIGLNRTRVPAAADVGVVIGAAEDAAGVVIRLDSADVPALLDRRFALVAVAVDTAGAVARGCDSAAVAAVIEFMVGVLPVAEHTADGVFAEDLTGVIAVVELVYVIFHFAEDAAGVVVIAVDIAVVLVVPPDAAAEVASDDAAHVLLGGNGTVVDVVF